MHPIDFIRFDREQLSRREAQFLEALLWIAGEMPRQVALQNGLSFEEAARRGAEIAVGLLSAAFPDLNLRVVELPRSDPATN